jgi:hypothetical protein
MSIKWILLILLVIVLTINGLTGGKFFNLIIPNMGTVVGHGICWAGGYIVNPVANIGGLQIPYPVLDDLTFAIFLTMPILYLFFRQKPMRSVLIAGVILFIIMLVFYKIMGYVFIYMAEHYYGMANCLTGISVAGQQVINYEWYSPIFILGFMFAAFALIGGIYKIMKWRKGGTNA